MLEIDESIYYDKYLYQNFSIIKIIGLIATFLGLLRFIPILHEVYKTKKTNNFTGMTIFFAMSSSILWLLFAIKENTLPLVISSLIAILSYIFIFYFKYKY